MEAQGETKLIQNKRICEQLVGDLCGLKHRKKVKIYVATSTTKKTTEND